MLMDQFSYIDRTEPNSPTSTTPTTAYRHPSEESDEANPRPNLRTLGRTVFSEVWNEFYNWEPDYCREILKVAGVPFDKCPVALAKAELAPLLAGEDARWRTEVTAARRAAGTSRALVVSVTHYAPGPQGRVRTTTTDVPMPVVALDPLQPHPKYESCSPISRIVAMSIVNENTLPFMPYADDDRFPAKKYQAMFETLGWETPFDPDVEIMEMETVRRLYAVHGIEVADIDEMKLFKGNDKESVFKAIHFANNVGLQWDLAQRDPLHWPGASRFQATREEQLPGHTPNPEHLRQRLMSNLQAFCPSINCVHSLCHTHDKMHVSTYIPSKKPKMSGKDFILSEGVPCGPDCFKHIQDFEKFMETLPPPPSRSHQGGFLDTLETVLGIAPDLFPCQLATICLGACKQIFAYRLQLFPDDAILLGDELPTDTDTRNSGHPRQRKRKLRFVDKVPCELTPSCAHHGPCISSNCPCLEKKRHCTLMCRCGVKCERQWPGCSCTSGRCQSKTCECARSGRECVPGICVSCDAGGHIGKPCENTKMQCLASKPVEIKCGSHGLGAFATQTINPETFLGSYAGFRLSINTADQIHELTKYTGYNYMFDAVPDAAGFDFPVVDAAYLGNATRFLNDSKNNQDNVEARYMLVVGEHQIGFFTNKKVRAGQELFLSYGKNYWGTYGG